MQHYLQSLLTSLPRSFNFLQGLARTTTLTCISSSTPALPTLAVLFTPAKAFRVPTDTQNSVMLSSFDRDSLCYITSKMGWEGRRDEKKLTKRYIKVWWQKSLSCDQGVCAHTHACIVYFICTFLTIVS